MLSLIANIVVVFFSITDSQGTVILTNYTVSSIIYLFIFLTVILLINYFPKFIDILFNKFIIIIIFIISFCVLLYSINYYNNLPRYVFSYCSMAFDCVDNNDGTSTCKYYDDNMEIIENLTCFSN